MLTDGQPALNGKLHEEEDDDAEDDEDDDGAPAPDGGDNGDVDPASRV